MLAGMHFTSEYIGRKTFDTPPIPVAGFDAAQWWENDGLVPTHSQTFPHTAGDHPVGIEFDATTPGSALAPGKWHVNWQRGMDHLDICLIQSPALVTRQASFYRDLFARLAALD